MADMQPRYYVCKNPDCRWSQEAREVYPLRMTGNGLYAWPPLYCECSLNIEVQGYTMQEQPALFVLPSPDGP